MGDALIYLEFASEGAAEREVKVVLLTLNGHHGGRSFYDS